MTFSISIIFMTMASLMIFFWIYLLRISNEDDIITSSAVKIIKLKAKIKSKRQQQIKFKRKNSITIAKLEDNLKQIERDKYANKSPVNLAGLALIRLLGFDSSNLYYKKLLVGVSEIYGDINAVVVTKSLIAESISYLFLGFSSVFIASVLIIETGIPLKGLLTAVLGVMIIITVIYMLYDNIFERIKRRRKAILRSFPQVITKLTLLVNAGIELTQAWRITSFSGHQILYLEMQTVCQELDNGIELKNAYKDFIARCNVKEISQLGFAIEQAYVKGNRELVKLLLDLVSAAGEERKHRAKRLGELANSKLLIPLMMIFVGIMILVIAPIVFNLAV